MSITHTFIPRSSDFAGPFASGANAISLDLSSRSKIVIHPKKLESKSTLAPRSIFKKNATEQPSTVENASHSVAQPVTVQGNSTPIPQQQVSPPKLRDSDWESKKHAKLAQVRRFELGAMGRIDKKPIQKRSPSPRVINPGSITPIIPIPRPEFQSPYLDEYAKCGCTKISENPCRRCQLMLLSDRFCALVDVQCKKWNAPVPQ